MFPPGFFPQTYFTNVQPIAPPLEQLTDQEIQDQPIPEHFLSGNLELDELTTELWRRNHQRRYHLNNPLEHGELLEARHDRRNVVDDAYIDGKAKKNVRDIIKANRWVDEQLDEFDLQDTFFVAHTRRRKLRDAQAKRKNCATQL